MKKKTLLPFLCLLLLLSACGREEPPEEAAGDGLGYTVDKEPLPHELAYSSSQYGEGEDIYLCGLTKTGQPAFVSIKGGVLVKYALPPETAYVHACCLGPEGPVLLAGSLPGVWLDEHGDRRENPQGEYGSFLLEYGPEGELERRLELDPELQQGQRFLSLRYHQGFYYALTETGLYQLRAGDGSLANILSLSGGSFVSQAVSARGPVFAYYNSSADGGDDSLWLSLLAEPEDWSFETLLTGETYSLNGLGTDQDGEPVINRSGKISALGGGEIFDFYERGFPDSGYSYIMPVSGGFLLSRPFAGELLLLRYGALPERTELILWADVKSQLLNQLISGFNMQNGEYQIKLVDTSGRSDEALNADLAGGNGPDLFYTMGGRYAYLSSEKAFEDLVPYMERSGSASADKLVGPVLEAMMDEEALYVMPLDFGLYTLSQRTDILPIKSDLTKALSLPELSSGEVSLFPAGASQADMWQLLSGLYLSANLNRAEGSCDFETEEFISLLRVCDAIDEDNMEFSRPHIFSFEQIPGLLRLIYLQQNYGDALSFRPELGCAFAVENSFALGRDSQHKEGAWQFIEYALDLRPEDQQFTWPMSRENLELLLDDAVTLGIHTEDMGDNVKLEPSQAEELLALIEAAAGSMVFDPEPDLGKIMSQEAQEFFSGDKSAEEAAALIQSRADIYLAERYG